MSLSYNSQNYMQIAQRYKHVIDAIYATSQNVLSTIDGDPFKAITLAQEFINSLKQVADIKIRSGGLDNLKPQLAIQYNISDPDQFVIDAENVVNVLVPEVLIYIQTNSSAGDYSLDFATGNGQLSNLPAEVISGLKAKINAVIAAF